MTDLDICKITAAMCGKKVVVENDATFLAVWRRLAGKRWDPLDNSDQAMECFEQLLRRGFNLGAHSATEHHVWDSAGDPVATIVCPPRELFARALAEIGKEETT